MSGGFDSKPGQSTLTAPPAPGQPEPGKGTLTAAVLPRTTDEAGPKPSNLERYDDMLAAVLAAKHVADGARPDDPAARAQILRLIEPIEHRLGQLNDHQGRLAQFGAGNIAGQTALDMSEAAIRSWRQLLLLGGMVRTDELVTRFRMGAEVIRFLTGEQRDAPTLREFNHVSTLVGVGAAAPVLAPPLVALAAGEAPLLAFAARVSARRVALWAATQPVAALALSEVLLGFGLQVGEDGWEPFWGQLQDPQGRWFVLAQVLMDYMHVRGSATPSRLRSAGPSSGTAVDLDAARTRLVKARVALRQVHDAVAAEPEIAMAEPRRATPAGSAVAHQTSTETSAPQVRATVSIQGFAQTPKSYPWRSNADGQVRTVAEARIIATSHGVHIPEDIHLVAVDSKRLPKDTFAKYFEKASHSATLRVSWDEFYNRLDKIPVQLSRDILGSDEAIVAVIAHEMHELNALRALFEERGGSIPAGELRNLIVAGRPGNLHDHAWDVADQLVAQMRGNPRPTVPAITAGRGEP
jgi:hypothetical protein